MEQTVTVGVGGEWGGVHHHSEDDSIHTLSCFSGYPGEGVGEMGGGGSTEQTVTVGVGRELGGLHHHCADYTYLVMFFWLYVGWGGGGGV